mgnify:CR=1 FL=1
MKDVRRGREKVVDHREHPQHPLVRRRDVTSCMIADARRTFGCSTDVHPDPHHHERRSAGFAVTRRDRSGLRENTRELAVADEQVVRPLQHGLDTDTARDLDCCESHRLSENVRRIGDVTEQERHEQVLPGDVLPPAVEPAAARRLVVGAQDGAVGGSLRPQIGRAHV